MNNEPVAEVIANELRITTVANAQDVSHYDIYSTVE